MNMLKQLNSAMEYIEANMCNEINVDAAAGIACVTADSFVRFFSYMTGMTLSEYIRRRRLTLACDDLKYSKTPIVEIAVKYGYDSGVSFSRAFKKQHGITPSDFRKNGGSIKAYPPASFHIIIKGAKKMDFRIIELEETEIYGISKQYEGEGYKNREELRHIMWNDRLDNIPEKLCEGKFNQPQNKAFDGVWFGCWQNGRYMIARKKEDVKTSLLERQIIPAGTYAAFTSERGGFAGVEIPKLFESIFNSWLPTSNYKLKNDTIIEVLHLWTSRELKKENRYYEVWIKKKKK